MNKSLLIATDWEYDADFIALLERSLKNYGFRSTVVNQSNLSEVYHMIRNGSASFAVLMDRASDTAPEFLKLQSLLHEKGSLIIDPVEQLRWVSDKATLHLEFLSAGIPTPYTLILPPYAENDTPALHVDDLAKLGRPFVIKPANTTGGGIGVVDGAESLQEILEARTEFRHDKYLIQEKIIPMVRNGNRYWFRSFYAGGQIFNTWWNDETHRYTLIDGTGMDPSEIETMQHLMNKIAEVARLTFFSSEITCCTMGRWVVVDYVNESCDMRLQSKHRDGVPDNLVERIADALVRNIAGQIDAVAGNS
ncbi:hypothetical protein JW948_19330 [bacterium]|nr:hypothetical protein [bacterium]